MEKTLKIMNPITHMNNIQQNIITSYFLFKKNKENGVYSCLTQENIPSFFGYIFSIIKYFIFFDILFYLVFAK